MHFIIAQDRQREIPEKGIQWQKRRVYTGATILIQMPYSCHYHPTR